MQWAGAGAEHPAVAFGRIGFDDPGMRARVRVGEERVIARFEIFIDLEGGRRVDAGLGANEIAYIGNAIGCLFAAFADGAGAAYRAAAVNIGFILIFHGVVAGGRACGNAGIGAACIACIAHAIGIHRAGLTNAAIGTYAAAIDIAFILIFNAVHAGGHGHACFGGGIAIARAAIRIVFAVLAVGSGAAHSAAIDIGFVLIFNAVHAGGHCGTGLRSWIADVGHAIAVLHAGAAYGAGRAATAAVDIGFGAVFHVVAACGRGRAGL